MITLSLLVLATICNGFYADAMSDTKDYNSL